MTVRTRFAPSPTGYLHIGGVRTALFCWLFARKNGGKFILRIDDTDQQRNVDEALEPILDGLRWLGIDWDEGPEVGGPHAPYYQSQRAERHRAAVEKLVDAGAAYCDYASTEEIQAERDAALSEKRPFVYSRRFMAQTPEDRARFEAQGRRAAVRLKMPREGTLVLNDLVRGRVEFEWAREQDHVIQRTNGSCLYHLASTVDDHDLEISHVIRAEEHLSNTPRQVFIAQSLGYPLPEYAHLPYVAEPGSKSKLSKRKLQKYLKNAEFRKLHDHGVEVAVVLNKDLDNFLKTRGLSADDEDRARIAEKLRGRLIGTFPTLSEDPEEQREMEDLCRANALDFFRHERFLREYERRHEIGVVLGIKRNPETFNPVVVDFYRDVGYLPEAIVNYLLLLGWSLDDKTEDFTAQEMIEHFSLERVIRSPASFDPQKLSAIQARYMERLPIEQKLPMVLPYLQKAGLVADPASDDVKAKLVQILQAAGDRIKVCGDILDYAELLLPDDQFPYDEKAFDKRVRQAGTAEWLRKYRDRLATADPFEAAALEELMRQFVEAEQIKLAQIIHAVRVAVTGKTIGFGLFETLAILGRQGSLARIDRALGQVSGDPRSRDPAG